MAEGDGVVDYVDANEIKIRYDYTADDELLNFASNIKTYALTKFLRTEETLIPETKLAGKT